MHMKFQKTFCGSAGAILLLYLPVSASAQSIGGADTYAARYDRSGRLVGSIGPDPDGSGARGYPAQRFTYDKVGRLTYIESGELASWKADDVNPSSWDGFNIVTSSKIQYDGAGRKVEEETKSYSKTVSVKRLSYDKMGNLLCSAVRMNTSSWLNGDDACSAQTPGPNGNDRITKYIYDDAGQILVIKQAYGTDLVQDYSTFSWTPNGQKSSVTDANGNYAALYYDGFDRLKEWHFPSLGVPGSASTTDYEEYEYDAAGNKTKIRKRDASEIMYTYDAYNRMVKKNVSSSGSGAPGYVVVYGYDLQGRQLSSKFNNFSGDGIVNEFDASGRLTRSSTVMLGTKRSIDLKYDKNGNRVSVVTPGGKWSFDYDGLNRLADLREGGADGSIMSTWTYGDGGFPINVAERAGSKVEWEYDGLGRLTKQTDSFIGGDANLTTELEYNPAQQIVSNKRSNASYTFAERYNISRDYKSNGLNQYRNVGSLSYSYDQNGNLISDGVRSFSYDTENRLISSSDGAKITYDPMGRIFKVESQGGSKQFLYDGDQLTNEFDENGNIDASYVHGPGADDPLLVYLSGASAQWFHRDQAGSITSLADGSTGSASGINTYDDFGIPGAGNSGRFQYTGQVWLKEFGVYHYKARAYSPTLGRFMQTDPVGYEDQINLYSYIKNDPVNGKDPTGESIVELGFLVLDVAETVSHVAQGAPASTLLNDAANIALDIAPIPGLREAKAGVEAARLAREAAQSSRRFANEAQKARTFERAAGKCEYCGSPITRAKKQPNTMHVDHIVPVKKGGTTTSSNLAGSCPPCNLSKGAKDLSGTAGKDKFVPSNPNERVKEIIQETLPEQRF